MVQAPGLCEARWLHGRDPDGGARQDLRADAGARRAGPRGGDRGGARLPRADPTKKAHTYSKGNRQKVALVAASPRRPSCSSSTSRLVLPDWMSSLSPFTHLPEVPAEPFELLPTLVLLVLAAGAVLVGLAGWQRRDVAT